MRDRTRTYTSELPRIGLQYLASIRRGLVDAQPGTQLYCHTEIGTLYTFRLADSYAMTINGVTRPIRTTTTQAGYGVREWYVCPHCDSRVAKLYIGKKDIACRKCWGLHYSSQSEDLLGRMRMDLRRQRYAIWGNTERTRNLANSPRLFPKPKGMRWETFNRRLARLMKCELAYWQAFAPFLDRLAGRCR